MSFYLSEIIRVKVVNKGKRVGKLAEIIIQETEKVPEVTFFIVKRAFGYPSLLIPWSNIKEVSLKKIDIDVDKIEDYEKNPDESQILLKDHILDKKVLDFDGNEVEIVYDVKLNIRKDKMYVSDVDCSKFGLFKRLGLRWLARFINTLAEGFRESSISWSYVQPLEQLSSFKGNVKLKVLKEKLPDIHPVDLADILEELDHDQRMTVFNELETEHASDTLEEVEPRVQRDLISSIDLKRAAEIINDMTPAQAADVLAILPSEDADNILGLMDKEDVDKIQSLMDRHEEKIMNYATNHFLTFPPETLVDDVFDSYRKEAKDKDVVMYIYVIDNDNKLLGVLDIKELLQSDMGVKLADIMTTNVLSLKEEDYVSEAMKMFNRYSFRAIPITNEEDILLGVIPFRDVMNLKHGFMQ